MKPRKPLAPTVPYNDLDLTRWKELDDVWTDSLWLIPSRARGNGHALEYHGNFVPQIATQAFTRFTREDDVVLDLFLGSGTSAVEALRLGRRCIGVELKPELAEHVRAKLGDDGSRAAVLCGDSGSPETEVRVREVLHGWEREHVDLAVLHPPYHDIIRFSDREEDLSNADGTEGFLDGFRRVADRAYNLLRPGRFAVVVIGDKYSAGELIPLGFECMRVMNEAGFRTRSIVVKNIEGNEVGKGRTGNLWRYRALRGGFYIFKHEYVLLFDKPAQRSGNRGRK
ncbi:MAG: TRM11 family SAM-dependent methyltransferase [Armatimonadota bacterium]